MQEVALLLKKIFGFDSFRPLQAEIIQQIIQKKDSLVLMPTGGGKSVCYQLPAVYLPGTALVISPLVALMKDQVEGLIANGVAAAALNSSIPEEEKLQIRQQALQGKLKLLYLSPEGLLGELNGLLPCLEISLIAVDEAHCISRWGHDFRMEYTQLSVVRERFPGVPVVALTATADKITRLDILEQLRLNNPQVFVSSFDRPNLSLTVHRGLGKKEKLAAILGFIRHRREQSGILYCMKRADTEDLARILATQGIRAAAYHAGLSAEQREQTQNDFIHDRTAVICATIAFGMGIDKSNVRWVIHYNMPGSIENYYQEIGRAGRDGTASDTLLFYSLADLVLLRRFALESGQDAVNLEKLNRMQRYCETDICRRRILLNYFGEETTRDCGNCDVCRNPPQRFDGSILVQKALSAILRTEERIGMQMLIDILRASAREELLRLGYDKLKTYGAGRDLPFRVWKEYLYQMLQLGYIEVDYTQAQTLKVTASGRNVLYGETKALLTTCPEPQETLRPPEKKGKKKTSATPPTTPIRILEANTPEETLMDSLRQLRRRIAQQENKAAYLIFSDATLEDMVHKKPLTREAFADIRGVGEVKLEKYGNVFVALIGHVLKK
ncbi:MAG: DNA helicase RecQ [Tannerellaceae bacterium]|jgi:ATP-dependent DNA helicase RecQ|nr:DNA helicase RecQ [Tannerellaceae bacterium]